VSFIGFETLSGVSHPPSSELDSKREAAEAHGEPTSSAFVTSLRELK